MDEFDLPSVLKNLCWVQYIFKKWKLIYFMTHALTNSTYFTHILWCWSPDPILCLNLLVHKCVLCFKTWAHHVPFLWITLPPHQIMFLSKLISSPPRLCHTDCSLSPWHHALSWHSYCRDDFIWVCISSAFYMCPSLPWEYQLLRGDKHLLKHHS